MKAEEVFKDELNKIQNPKIKDFVLQCFDELCPDYFWTCPCSTSGKYHPKVSLGEGGLVRHVKLTVWWGVELVKMWPTIPETAHDEILAALLLHDLIKNDEGLGEDGRPLDRSVTGTHGVTLANRIEAYYDLAGKKDVRFRRIVTAIRDHMGKWTTGFIRTTEDVVQNIKEDHIVCITTHLADYCASRKVDDKMLELLETDDVEPTKS